VQVRSKDVAANLTVSVLERHKLKRPASCISFHSNRGEMKRIQPRAGRYFSYNYPAVDGTSRKALRRERRMELLKEMGKKKNEIKGRVVEVFTEQGRAGLNNELGDSEVGGLFYSCRLRGHSVAHVCVLWTMH
jgi:hypothetical protein